LQTDEARQQMLAGVNALANAVPVQVTTGPTFLNRYYYVQCGRLPFESQKSQQHGIISAKRTPPSEGNDGRFDKSR
jgi:hypothetical protein